MQKENILSFACFLALSLSIFACEAPPQSPPGEASLREAVATFNDAFARGNTQEIADMITKDYRHTNGTSAAIDRDTWLAYIQKRQQELESGELVIHHYALEEMGVSLHGSAAIVTGRVVVEQSRQGERGRSEYRITNVWVHENGHWKRAGFHDGKIR